MALWSLCLNVAKFAIDDIDDDLRTSLKVFWFLQSDCVGWSWSSGSRFFSNRPCQNVKKLIEFQKYFPISAKAMPWSLWKWLGSQRIFEGIKFPNPIGYSPGQAHVTNIDPKCSFFYWAWKSENRIPIFSLVYLGCPWGCILKSTLVAPALKENIFEKVKQNTRKRMSPNTTAKERQRVCMIVLDDHGLSVPPLFFQIDLVKMFKKS